MKNGYLTKLRGLTVIAFAMLILFSPLMQVHAENPSFLTGKITVGLLFDETTTKEMKDEILKNNGVIANSNEGEMFKISASSFELQLISNNGKYSYKTFIDANGNYNFSDVKTGKYQASLVLEDKVLTTQDIIINKGKINDLIIGLTLDEYLNAAMDHEEGHKHSHEEEANLEAPEAETVILEQQASKSNESIEQDSDVVSYSHKYPYKPCLDYNGWNAPDSRHVHDWAHFYGSDCFLAAWIGCTGDHNNYTEYCDGTKNCSSIIGHKTYYHSH